MRVTKCDLCKREIKDKVIHADVGYLNSAELCGECGLPILKFLKKNKFLKEEKNKSKLN